MSALGYRTQKESSAAARLICRACGHQRIATAIWIAQLRVRAPCPELSDGEVLARMLPLFACSLCHAKRVELLPKAPADEEDDLSPQCVQCGESIALEWLLAAPWTPFCASCQEQFERGAFKPA